MNKQLTTTHQHDKQAAPHPIVANTQRDQTSIEALRPYVNHLNRYFKTTRHTARHN